MMNILEKIVEGLARIDEGQNIDQWITETFSYNLREDSRSIQKKRVGSRFLRRYEQFRNNVLGIPEILSALRDCLLFVGLFDVPALLMRLVDQHGREYGLSHVSNKVYVVVSEKEWFSNDRYLRESYGKDVEFVSAFHHSSADAYLIQATPFNEYRSFEQKVAVHTALTMPDGYTVLISLPTGAGKSLITQMIAAYSQGLAILVIPTVALGLDQYRAARATLETEVVAPEQIACYCGNTTAKEQQEIFDAITSGSLRLLITSPEAIVKNQKLKESIYHVAEVGLLKYVIVDEAHIIQDWGASFRPDFQVLSVIRRDLLHITGGTLRTVLLSATLTENTAAQLQALMSDSDHWIVLRNDALRTEPRYLVEGLATMDAHRERIIQLCKILPKPMIVYEIMPERAEWWKQLLEDKGFRNVVTFTGDTPDVDRERVIQAWDNGELDLVVATSAFGMGIDKADVRSVVHATIPEGLNRFYQEVGRGGRDGLPSLSILSYFKSDDGKLQKTITDQRVLSTEYMVDRWFSMLNAPYVERHGDTALINASEAPSYFTPEQRAHKGNHNRRWNIYVVLFLLRNGFLDLYETLYDPTTRDYYFRVGLRDSQVLQNPTLLNNALDPLREEELKQVQTGFLAMRELIQHAHKECVALHFVSLFPHAATSCGGCMAFHTPYSNDGDFILSQSVPIYTEVRRERVPFSLRRILITVQKQEGARKGILDPVVLELNRNGYETLVVPEVRTLSVDQFRGLTLEIREFLHLLSIHPSLFLQGGLIGIYGTDDEANQLMFHAMQRLEQYGIPIAYVCSDKMIIKDMNKPIAEIVNSRILTIDEVMEVF